MDKNSLKIFFLIPIIILFIAPVFKFPYGFYTFLRLVIFISSCFIVYEIFKTFKKININIIIFSLILILYNPIIPVYLSREIWLPINFVTAFFYIYNYYKVIKEIK